MRVMILDNDEAWTRSLQLLLEGRGHQVDAFTDPVKGCVFIETTSQMASGSERDLPDALVLDYVMPQMNGFDVLDRIHGSLGPQCRILLVTGHGDQICQSDLEKHGIAEYVEKPVDLDALEHALREKVG